jgi:hypothetical protein
MTRVSDLSRLTRAVFLAAALTASACSAEVHRAEIVYRVASRDGGVPDDAVLRGTISELSLRLSEGGVPRHEVLPMGTDRIRVVLPESAVARLASIREMLEKPDGLVVTLAEIERR